MKAIALASLLASTSVLAADVGVSITLGQPGFYGQINIGNDLAPRLILPQPVIIAPPPPNAVVLAPIYLRVPPGHRKDWGRYCSTYGACGRQVYFVDDDWYEHEYVPRYQERHHGHDHGDHDNDHGHRGKGKHGRGHD